MWNGYNFLKESKIQEDIMNAEKEIAANPSFHTKQSKEDAIKLAVQELFSKNNINLAYDPALHQFLKKERKDLASISGFLSYADETQIRTILRALRQREIQYKAELLAIDYSENFKDAGVTEEEFSHMLQATTINSEPVQEVIRKVGKDKVAKQQSKFLGVYLNSLTNLKSGNWTPLLFGKVSPELQEKIKEIQGREWLQSAIDELKFDEGDLKKEVLMASEFSPMLYPISNVFFWPPFQPEYSNEIKNKVVETFDITRPEPVIEAITSANSGAIIFGDNSNKIKTLYEKKFRPDTEKFLQFIADILIQDGNPQETVETYIQTIRSTISSNIDDKAKSKEKKRDILFPELATYFDSKKEKEIVDLIREEFNLTCVTSKMEFPITNDFTMNVEHFITDFVIYCDGLVFEKKEQNGIGYEVPVIKHRLLLIGEYYGYDSVEKSQPLKHDLFNPDGTPFLKPDNQPALKGDILTIGQEYKYKTEYKKITNDFCGKAIGCKTISINKATSREVQRNEVASGLDENKVLYNTSFKDVSIQSDALLSLIKWYKNPEVPNAVKQEYRPIIEKYLNPETLEKKNGRDYPLAYQNPKSKYLGTIYEALHLIKSKDLFAAIQQSKGQYSSATLRDEEKAREYLESIKLLRYNAEKLTAERRALLVKLFKEIQSIPVENGVLKYPINNIIFLEFINKVCKFNEKTIKSKIEYPNIYAIKKAFNYFKHIKRGTITK